MLGASSRQSSDIPYNKPKALPLEYVTIPESFETCISRERATWDTPFNASKKVSLPMPPSFSSSPLAAIGPHTLLAPRAKPKNPTPARICDAPHAVPQTFARAFSENPSVTYSGKKHAAYLDLQGFVAVIAFREFGVLYIGAPNAVTKEEKHKVSLDLGALFVVRSEGMR